MTTTTKGQIFIHIGYPKTGSTALQNYSFPKLTNITYLGKLYDSDKFYFKKNPLSFLTRKEIYLENLKNIAPGNYLISDEGVLALHKDLNLLFDQLELLISNIKILQATGNWDIEIIYLWRELEELLPSLFLQGYGDKFKYSTEKNSYYKFIQYLSGNIEDYKKILDRKAVENRFLNLDINIQAIKYEDWKEKKLSINILGQELYPPSNKSNEKKKNDKLYFESGNLFFRFAKLIPKPILRLSILEMPKSLLRKHLNSRGNLKEIKLETVELPSSLKEINDSNKTYGPLNCEK